MARKRHTVGRGKRLVADRVRLNSQGYDSRGRYWGTGAPLYRVTDDENGNEHYVRAGSAAIAKANAIPELERLSKRDAWKEYQSRYPGGSYGDLDPWIKAGKP